MDFTMGRASAQNGLPHFCALLCLMDLFTKYATIVDVKETKDNNHWTKR